MSSKKGQPKFKILHDKIIARGKELTLDVPAFFDACAKSTEPFVVKKKKIVKELTGAIEAPEKPKE